MIFEITLAGPIDLALRGVECLFRWTDLFPPPDLAMAAKKHSLHLPFKLSGRHDKIQTD